MAAVEILHTQRPGKAFPREGCWSEDLKANVPFRRRGGGVVLEGAGEESLPGQGREGPLRWARTAVGSDVRDGGWAGGSDGTGSYPNTWLSRMTLAAL